MFVSLHTHVHILTGTQTYAAGFLELIQVCSTLECEKKWVDPLRKMKKFLVSFMFIYLLVLVEINFNCDDFSPIVNSRFFSKIPDIFCNPDGFLRKIHRLKRLLLRVFSGTMYLMLLTAKV